jgi:hypothetical protein
MESGSSVCVDGGDCNDPSGTPDAHLSVLIISDKLMSGPPWGSGPVG